MIQEQMTSKSSTGFWQVAKIHRNLSGQRDGLHSEVDCDVVSKCEGEAVAEPQIWGSAYFR